MGKLTKLVPGVGIAESVSDVARSHAEAKSAKANAKLALAENDPSAHTAAERHKTTRTAIIVGAGILAVGGVVGGAAYMVNRAANGLEGIAGALKPKPLAAVSGEVALQHIELPNTVIVGSAEGKATVNVHAENKVGPISIPGTGFDIPIATTGAVDIRVENAPDNITLSIVKNDDGNEAIQAQVQADAVVSHLSDPWIDPNLTAGNGLFTRLTGDDSQARASAVTNFAFGKLQDCKDTIRPTIEPGLQSFIGGMLTSTSNLVRDKDSAVSDELTKLAAQPISVVFMSGDRIDNTKNVTSAELPLPGSVSSVSNDELAQQLGVSPENINVSDLTCNVSPTALNDMLKLNAEFAGTGTSSQGM